MRRATPSEDGTPNRNGVCWNCFTPLLHRPFRCEERKNRCRDKFFQCTSAHRARVGCRREKHPAQMDMYGGGLWPGHRVRQLAGNASRTHSLRTGLFLCHGWLAILHGCLVHRFGRGRSARVACLGHWSLHSRQSLCRCGSIDRNFDQLDFSIGKGGVIARVWLSWNRQTTTMKRDSLYRAETQRRGEEGRQTTIKSIHRNRSAACLMMTKPVF